MPLSISNAVIDLRAVIGPSPFMLFVHFLFKVLLVVYSRILTSIQKLHFHGPTMGGGGAKAEYENEAERRTQRMESNASYVILPPR